MPSVTNSKRVATDTYLELVKKFPLVSLAGETELAQAHAMRQSLLSRHDLDAGQAMYLDALTDLIKAKESQNHRRPKASASEVLRRLMDARGITQAELACQTGIGKPAVSELLSGKRPFSKSLIVKLSQFFSVSTDFFMLNSEGGHPS